MFIIAFRYRSGLSSVLLIHFYITIDFYLLRNKIWHSTTLSEMQQYSKCKAKLWGGRSWFFYAFLHGMQRYVTIKQMNFVYHMFFRRMHYLQIKENTSNSKFLRLIIRFTYRDGGFQFTTSGSLKLIHLSRE